MWKSLNINKQNIKQVTAKAVLISCPHNSDYNNYCFWHPLTLLKKGKHSNAVEINYPKEFVFSLIKFGKGKYNKYKKLNEIKLNCEEIELIFEEMNANITSPIDKNVFETHKPTQLKAQTVTADDSLIDNE